MCEGQGLQMDLTIIEGHVFLSADSLLDFCKNHGGAILQSDIEHFLLQVQMGSQGMPLEEGTEFHEVDADYLNKKGEDK